MSVLFPFVHVPPRCCFRLSTSDGTSAGREAYRTDCSRTESSRTGTDFRLQDAIARDAVSATLPVAKVRNKPIPAMNVSKASCCVVDLWLTAVIWSDTDFVDGIPVSDELLLGRRSYVEQATWKFWQVIALQALVRLWRPDRHLIGRWGGRPFALESGAGLRGAEDSLGVAEKQPESGKEWACSKQVARHTAWPWLNLTSGLPNIHGIGSIWTYGRSTVVITMSCLQDL